MVESSVRILKRAVNRNKERQKYILVISINYHLVIFIFGVDGVDEDALNIKGLETLNILGNIVARLANTSSDIP